jgi:hypothetical protein
MYAIVCLLAILCPFAIAGLLLQVYHYFDRMDDLNEQIGALEHRYDGVIHTLQDEERDHTAAEMELDEAEMELAECAAGLEGYIKTVEEQDAKIAELLDMVNTLEDTVLDLRINAAGQKSIAKPTKRARKAS